MSDQDQAKSATACPVCRTLPLHAVTSGLEGPPMEYQLTADVDGSGHHEEQFDRCALYFLARSLYRIWSGAEVFPTHAQPSSSSHQATCGKPAVLLDPQSPIAVHPDPCHPAVVSRLREWIQLCDNSHEGCRVDDVPLLPSRVLDTDGAPSSEFVKLIEVTDGQRGSYIALSHCWGASNPFITTRRNLAEMKSGFSINKAPATFRDAVKVSRLLGIRYVWIDSLCIIQGDAKDWEIEASRMSKIYRDATLMLSAARAAADSEGFLTFRPITCRTLRITTPAGQHAEVYLQTRVGEETRYNEQTLQPVDTRGWCLQELYLARRQVKFLDNRIQWHCQDAIWDESRRDTDSHLKGAGAIMTTDKLFRNSGPRRNRTLNIMTPYQGWYRMIADFTKRKLTFATDKFPALSGLASAVAEHDQGEYLAGIWWEDVAFGICWKKISLLPTMDEYIAPSWSWASVDGPVEFIDAHEGYLTQTKLTLMSTVTFHSFHVQYRGSNDYGRLENAWIKLEAPMAALERVDEETFRICGMETLVEQAELTLDFHSSGEGELAALFLMRRLDNSQETQLIHMGIEKGVLGVILFGLIIRVVSHPTERCSGLGLQDGSQIYERVGFFRILTPQHRESEFWDGPVKSIMLV